MDAEATTLVYTVIWTLRICLPVILFLLYYRVPFPDILPKKHRHDRSKLLQFRPASKGTPPPEMATIGLIDQATAPHLFVTKKRGKGEGRGSDVAAPKTDENKPPVFEGKLPPQDMLHLESLLNYMAFNRKSHRIFHPLQPPPPPSAPPPPNNAAPSPDFQQKANLDAQMVLQGALMFKKLEVVTDVYDSLTNTKVQPSEQTFALMVEVCIAAHDLPKASDFLMKMEQCQYSPDAKLLDRVMELYAQHKVTTELGQRLNAEKGAQDLSNGVSNGLSADAPEFVPTHSPGGAEEWTGNAWPAWSGKSGWDAEWPKAKKGGKDGKGAGKGKGKGWQEKGWNKWQSEDWKAQAAKGKEGKDKGRAEKGDKGKAKGKGKESTSDMPEKAKKTGGGAVWRKKDNADSAPQDA